jgi:hypothetical protein
MPLESRTIYNDLVILSRDGGRVFNKNASRTVYNEKAKQHDDRTAYTERCEIYKIHCKLPVLSIQLVFNIQTCIIASNQCCPYMPKAAATS